MKNFLDLPDTDLYIRIHLAAHRGNPQVLVTVNEHKPVTVIASTVGETLQYRVACSDALKIALDFVGPKSSAVLINGVQVDDFDFVPDHTHWASYGCQPTTLLDKPGRWCLDLQRPFYCWLHEVTGQGWLFD